MFGQRSVDGIDSREISTPRLATYLLESGPEEGEPVLFVHGNVASSVFLEEKLTSLPPGYLGLAPDLRDFAKPTCWRTIPGEIAIINERRSQQFR